MTRDGGGTVLLTGAGSGIGRAVALTLADCGRRLALVDIDDTSVTEVAAEATRRGARAVLVLPADVSREDQVERAVSVTIDELGVPTAVFANAGIEMNGPAHDLPIDDWRRVIDVNLTGVFLTAKHSVRAMVDAHATGAIVCTASPSAFVGFAGGGNAAYGASKGGIVALVKSLAVDYAPAGIRVNAVVPGAIDTPLLVAGVPESDRTQFTDQLRTRAAAQIPMRRLGQPAEVAAAVVWLLSPAASYVTGSSLVCDGGLLARSANDF